MADAVKQAVEQGFAESQNAFVERALIRELQDLRRRRVYDAYAKASADPLFLKEMRAIADTFDSFTGEGLRDGRD